MLGCGQAVEALIEAGPRSTSPNEGDRRLLGNGSLKTGLSETKASRIAPLGELAENPTLRERQLDRSASAQTLVNRSAFLEAHPDQPMCSAKHTRFYWRTWPRCRKMLFN